MFIAISFYYQIRILLSCDWSFEIRTFIVLRYNKDTMESSWLSNFVCGNPQADPLLGRGPTLAHVWVHRHECCHPLLTHYSWGLYASHLMQRASKKSSSGLHPRQHFWPPTFRRSHTRIATMSVSRKPMRSILTVTFWSADPVFCVLVPKSKRLDESLGFGGGRPRKTNQLCHLKFDLLTTTIFQTSHLHSTQPPPLSKIVVLWLLR